MYSPAHQFARSAACLFAAICLSISASAQAPMSQSEARAARAYMSAQKEGPLALRAFLDQFPKGADLHVHLSGAVYAETFIHDAGEDGLCVDKVQLKFAKPPCTGNLMPATDFSANMTPTNQDIYGRLIERYFEAFG